MKKKFVFSIFIAAFSISLNAQDLSISTTDLRLEMRADGGFHLFIRKKPDISSVLLTESTRDPAMRSDNYAYRAGEWNAVNGDEIRLLNGVPIPKESRIYSLISSTIENHVELGQAFHIYIPYVLYYGYEGGRNGEVHLTDGTYLNIRAFALLYADYRGAFRDNPFALEARQEPPAGPPQGIYMQETLAAFMDIAFSGNGDLIYSRNPDDVTDLIRTVLERERGKSLDVVICLDTTNSMKKYIDPLRARLIPMLNELLGRSPSFRIGMVLYKDYYDEYLTKIVPFTSDFSRFQNDLNAIRVGGGGDIPEAVYEALYDGAVKFSWEAESRIMILIGDAPPHPKPRGKITRTMAERAAIEKNIKVYAILLPQ
jgi:Mg-chelatase subunit ChlD